MHPTTNNIEYLNHPQRSPRQLIYFVMSRTISLTPRTWWVWWVQVMPQT